jgi:hypothetical protein
MVDLAETTNVNALKTMDSNGRRLELALKTTAGLT